jgi:CheY-like chemotaxis protein
VKILVADDSRIMRQIIIRTLRQAGYDGHDIVEAVDGRDALAKVRSERPGLVLCDWHMPGMTGMHCLQALRTAGSAVPFGFITSDVSPELRREAAAAGAQFVLGKPFNEETLREALDGNLQPGSPPPGQPKDSVHGEERGRNDGGGLVPAAKDVRDLLAELLGRPVTVHPGPRVTPSGRSPASLAVYVGSDSAVNAVCMMDLALSAYAAGALALLPPGGVQDVVEERELGPTLAEVLHEVANVLSALVNTPGAPRSQLDELYPAGAYLPDELLVMTCGFERLDLVVEVSGYGEGALSLVRTR